MCFNNVPNILYIYPSAQFRHTFAHSLTHTQVQRHVAWKLMLIPSLELDDKPTLKVRKTLYVL